VTRPESSRPPEVARAATTAEFPVSSAHMTSREPAIPGYRIQRELGRGGMATVYLAIQESLGREVALKLISPLLSADPSATQRFLREGRIAAKLADRHIVGIHDVGMHEGQPYIAMEYMHGGAVSASTARAPHDALEIAREIALALDHAHREEVIHRDIKPENILRRADGSYALSDFGIARTFDSTAKLTQDGMTVGTPFYMSPEQLQGLPLDGRSDLYSLGIVLYQLLTGLLPHRSADGVPIIARGMLVAEPRPLPPHLQSCQSLMDRLLAEEPIRRPQSGAELAKELELLRAEFTIESSPTRQVVRAKTRRRATLAVAAGAAALALAVGGAWWWNREASPASAGVASGLAAAARGIAVLPLLNTSGSKDEQFFSEGLSENLIVTLSQFSGLRVIGRNSSFQFRDTKDDARAIGIKLGVAHLLEGSVQHAGDMVRVSAELIRTADSTTIWSQRYDRPYKDLFALQDEIASAVANALKAKLLPGETTIVQTDRPPGGDLNAYDAYLHGRFYYLRNSQADLRKAIDYFTTATTLDPQYAQASAWASQAWVALASQFLDGVPAQQGYDTARKTADAALALAPDLAGAHLARGMVLQTVDFDWRGAEAEYRRAVQLAPEDSQAKQRLGYMLATLGQMNEAVDLTRQALTIDPLNSVWHIWLGRYLAGIGRLDEADAMVRKAIELQPAAAGFYYQLTIIELQRGDAAGALASAEQEKPSIFRDIAVALARQANPDREGADAALKGLVDKYAAGAAFQVAQAYALREDPDSMFEWLDRAWTNRDVGVLYLLYDPFVTRYRSDPRFAAFCRKAGLPSPGP
jgi:serine/threonine protein kinase/tetratricopeptide (TPR) repeat protein